MRRLFSIACLTTVSGLSLCGCGHVRPIEGVEAAAVALDVYVDQAAERLESTADAAIEICNERSRTRDEYFECIAPADAALSKAESALRQLVTAQAAGFDALQAAKDFEAAIQEVQ